MMPIESVANNFVSRSGALSPDCVEQAQLPGKGMPSPEKRSLTELSQRHVQLKKLSKPKPNAGLPQATSPTINPHGSSLPLNNPRKLSQRMADFIKTNKQNKFKWQPEQQFIVCADPSNRATSYSAKSHRNERKIPDKNYFNMSELEGKSTLDQLDLTSRLTLHGHGNWAEFVSKNADKQEIRYNAWALGEFLHDSGLRQVGVLKLKSCNIGKKGFLKILVSSLRHHGTEVGYASAPTSTYGNCVYPMKIRGRRFNIQAVPYYFPKVVGLLPEKYGLKTVKGNVDDLVFPGTRYNLPPLPK